MVRLLYAIVTGLVGAGLLHIVIVLALPHFSVRDAYHRALQAGPAGRFNLLEKGAQAGPLMPDDPFVQAAVCAFSLEGGPQAVSASGPAAFWSFSVFDRASNEVFSISDRSAEAGRLDAIVATPAQAAHLRKADPAMAERRILIETRGNEGYLVLRSLSPHPSTDQEALGFLMNARCETLRR